jgi:mycofactocin precursor peptide peptidase
MNYRLAEMTWPEVAEAVAAGATTVILPLGSTEQHGPHLPLGTDTMRAAALADRLAAYLPEALVAQPLPIGCSDEHAGFPGLLSLGAETLASVIVDCARRLVTWRVERLILLSAHGGNGSALALAAERLRHELPELRVWTPDDLLLIANAILAEGRRDGISPEVLGLHAGEGETSELLWLHPDLVRFERAAPGFTGDMKSILPKLREAGLLPVTPNGVLGDPTRAQAVRGERYLNIQAEQLATELKREFEPTTS